MNVNENYIEDFEIVRQIGKGSFSNVFLCKKEIPMMIINETEDLFIIKEINTNTLVKKYIKESNKNRFKAQQNKRVEIILTPYNDILTNTEHEYYYNKLRDLITSEIEILSDLDNENIVKFYKFSKIDGIYYIRMEYCNGGDLYEYIKNVDFLDNNKKEHLLYEFCYQISNGLKYIHEKNIIHRDIKLQNILVKNALNKIEFKISDFGFACYDLSNESLQFDLNTLNAERIGEQDSNLCKKYYKLCGTPYYMAPEIVINMNTTTLSNVKFYNKNIDIWSFGICIYELIFQTFPFTNIFNIVDLENFYKKNAQEIITNKINNRKIIKKEFKNFLLGLLSVDNYKRYNIKDIIQIVNEDNFKIYSETDLEKEMVEIINCTENVYVLKTKLSNKLHEITSNRNDTLNPSNVRLSIQDSSWEKINGYSFIKSTIDDACVKDSGLGNILP